MNDRALVLGGGGLAGIAWMSGLAHGLAESGVALANANRIIGTSAGAVVAAQLANGTPPSDLYQRQVDPALQPRDLPPKIDRWTLIRHAVPILLSRKKPAERTIRIGRMARAAKTRALQARLDILAERLPSQHWPKRDIRIVAVDTESGEAVEFGAQDGVDLLYAVAASCALPLLWPPVSINNHSYMDGGMRSPDNADLATGFGKVLVISPTAKMGLKLAGWDLEAQIGRLKAQGAEVHLVEPDTAARMAIGRNPLAPETRQPSAEAGLAQGRKAAAAVAKFWGK